MIKVKLKSSHTRGDVFDACGLASEYEVEVMVHTGGGIRRFASLDI